MHMRAMRRNIAPWAVRVSALVRRERTTRFAGGALGALWAFITPAAWVGAVVMIYRLLGRTPPIFAPLEIFSAAGILPYIMFRQTVNSMMRGAVTNRQLLLIRGVRVADLMTASALQELVNTLVTMVLIFGAVTLVFHAPLPVAPGKVLLGMGCAWIMGVGVGRLLGMLGMMSDAVFRAAPLLMRPLFWLSGIFYTANELSGQMREYLWWSPVFHAIEIVREGYFLGFHSPIVDLRYVLIVALLPYALSFPLEILVERRGAMRHRI